MENSLKASPQKYLHNISYANWVNKIRWQKVYTKNAITLHPLFPYSGKIYPYMQKYLNKIAAKITVYSIETQLKQIRYGKNVNTFMETGCV